ncbi:CaiB/BaiF CoA transferase family protein [Bradyrhizobium ottawaense]|uniref:CaiB/BaiF CoA transferase family protein n=1 Tax=Bradyrhizobium ottawaense TaxID=931866 RepID=UPI003836D571
MTIKSDYSKAGGPLAGVRVLDLTSVVLGPYATQMLGDLGADVIKIEGPDADSTRFTGPCQNPGMAALYMGVNRNKRSLVLDLKQPAGRNALLRLVDQADVFVHNIRPQGIKRLGLDPDAILSRNPRLIYAGLYGWREGGPYAGRPAYDDIIQGMCGFASLMGHIAGEPRYAPTIIADKTCGLVAAQTILAALLHRERTGRGQFVEIPMFETMVAFVMVEHLYGRTFGDEGKSGYSRVLAAWRRPYQTKDGYVCMMAYTDAQWTRFWSAVGKPDMMSDERFKNLAARSDHIDEVYRLAGLELKARSNSEWLALFESLEIPAGRVNSVSDLFSDPQLVATGFFRTERHPTEGDIIVPDIPVRFAETPGTIRLLPPRFGEHSEEVLRESGLTETEVAELVATRVTVVPGRAVRRGDARKDG